MACYPHLVSQQNDIFEAFEAIPEGAHPADLAAAAPTNVTCLLPFVCDTEESIMSPSPHILPAPSTIVSFSTIAVTTGYVFMSYDALVAAVNEWCDVTKRKLAERRYGHISTWNTNRVSCMNRLFFDKKYFNDDISSWDVSNVTDMSCMFHRAYSFNQPIGSWDVSNVTDMSCMFFHAVSFNQPIGSWDVSNVTMMSRLFQSALSFNQPIGSWNVGNVTNMSCMFLVIRGFDVINKPSEAGFFNGTSSFNQPIGSWDISQVTSMSCMFDGAVSFNQPIGSWNVSKVLDMSDMFCDATSFDQPIGSWDVTNVFNMLGMFSNATSFNQPIGSWDVSNVDDMRLMFCDAHSFNQPIGAWDVGYVMKYCGMFAGATSFDRPIGSWCLTKGQRDEDEDEGFYIGDEFKDMDRLNYGVIATSKLFKSRKVRNERHLKLLILLGFCMALFVRFLMSLFMLTPSSYVEIRSTQSLLSCAACKLALIMECAKTCVMITKATPAYASSAA